MDSIETYNNKLITSFNDFENEEEIIKAINNVYIDYTKKNKKIPKKDKQKRDPTAYNIYCKKKMPEIKLNNPDMKQREVLKEAARLWQLEK